MKQFYIATLGCKVNQTESGGLAKLLIDAGWSLSAPEQADAILVNSCAVTAESVKKAGKLLRSLRRRNPAARIVLTGCWPQAFPDDTFPEADFVTGTRNRADAVSWILRGGEEKKAVCPFDGTEDFPALPAADTSRTRAFLKIQDGCGQYCSYCVIPYARGRCRSMPLERLSDEARRLAQAGFREIVLTGINLGFYGVENGATLADAVSVCAENPGIARVRLSSLEPERVDTFLLDALKGCEKFCPQFHLSLQSGSDTVLARMNRRYTARDYEDLAGEIRLRFPGAALTTDVIVGFPGETDEEFAQTLAFVKRLRFQKIHVFPFSPREGTKAADMPDQVPPRVKRERVRALTAAADELRQSYFRSLVGENVRVLIEGGDEKPMREFSGHTENGTPVRIFSQIPRTGLRNQIIDVRIDSYGEDSCRAAL